MDLTVKQKKKKGSGSKHLWLRWLIYKITGFWTSGSRLAAIGNCFKMVANNFGTAPVAEISIGKRVTWSCLQILLISCLNVQYFVICVLSLFLRLIILYISRCIASPSSCSSWMVVDIFDSWLPVTQGGQPCINCQEYIQQKAGAVGWEQANKDIWGHQTKTTCSQGGN